MATKKTTAKANEEVVKAEAVATEVKETEVEAEVKEAVAAEVKETEAGDVVACIGYIPVELRTKLETVAGKMLDRLIGFNGEFNASQLKSVETAMEIYRTLRY